MESENYEPEDQSKVSENDTNDSVNEPESDQETEGLSQEAIFEAYKSFVGTQQHVPSSIGQLCLVYNLDADEVKAHFADCESIESAIWDDYLERTLLEISGQEVYPEYSVREKLLSFYYTLFETLKPDRDFAAWRLDHWNFWNPNPGELKSFQQNFEEYLNALIGEGLVSGEIAGRMVLGEKYAGWHRYQLWYILTYWADDKSEDFQHSDEAVEKTVNLGFDLMGENVLDTAFDFLKFWWQK